MVKERFWEQIIVDVLINNNDRNNGNWGILYEDGIYKLAPVFGNGASFSNKLPDNKLEEMLKDPARFSQSANMSKTIYTLNGKLLFAKYLALIENKEFHEMALGLVALIKSKMDEIIRFVNDIESYYNDIQICSNIRKKFHIKSMEYRLENFLEPLIGEKNIKNFKKMY